MWPRIQHDQYIEQVLDVNLTVHQPELNLKDYGSSTPVWPLLVPLSVYRVVLHGDKMIQAVKPTSLDVFDFRQAYGLTELQV